MMRITILLFLSTFISYSFASSVNPSSNQERQIEVTGVGTVFSIPDTFSFSLVLEEKGQVAADLNSVMNQKSQQVINALQNLGVQKKSIQALLVRFNPWIEYANKHREQKGFVLTRTINVTVTDLSLYEKAIDQVLTLPIKSISNFKYSSSHSDAHYQASLRQALLQAKNKATDMANTLDLNLGKVISISEESVGQVTPSYVRMQETTSSNNYQPGEMTTTTHVRVKFSLQ